MLYLNNPLLTSEGIIATFEANVLHKALPSEAGVPSPLKQFKNKLKAVFFENLGKSASDASVLNALRTEARFTSNFPNLKQVLDTIFSLKDNSDTSVVLTQLKAINVRDWNMDNAQTQFDELNTKYGYFEQATPALFTVFSDIAVSYRAMLGLIEGEKSRWQGGTYYHLPEDQQAYFMAYQIMALSIDQSEIANPGHLFDKIAQATFKLLTQTDSKKEQPFKELNIYLPLASEVQDKQGWRNIIKKEGQKALPFLSQAPEIERKIAEQSNETARRAPRSLDEAKSMAMLCKYERATESTESLSFAKLCNKYHVRVSRYDRSLDYMALGWPKKVSDSIPDVIIKGEGDTAGLYWVKLSPADKRALILGDILDNCQSIGGKGESCVKDSVSLGDNGLYVMLQQSGKGHPNPKNPDGSINDADFKIIGTSYVWKSNTGNICLDSYEGLRDSINDTILQKMLSNFATTLLKDNPEMKRITLGRGGKTPPDLFQETAIADEKSQGLYFPDSKSQYCIAKTPHGLDDTQSQALRALLKKHESYGGQYFNQCIEHLSYYVTDRTHFVEQLNELLTKYPTLEQELTPTSLSRLLSLTTHPTLDDLAPVHFDELDALPPEQKTKTLATISIARLIWKEDTVPGLIHAFQYVPHNQQLPIVKTLNWGGSSYEGSGQTVLHAAAKDPDLLKVMLALYPNEQRLEAVKEKNEMDSSVLHFSARNPESLRIILAIYPEEERLIALNEKDKYGATVLHKTIGNPESLKLILSTYPETIKEKDNTGRTALASAVNGNQLDSLQIIFETLTPNQLLEALNERDHQDQTPLQLAATQRREPGALLALLAQYPKDHLIDALNAIDNDFYQQTALHLAAGNNIDSLNAMIKVYPPEQLLTALKRKSKSGSVLYCAANEPDAVKTLLAFYPEDQRIEALNEVGFEDKTILHKVASSPDSFELMMNVFPTSQLRIEALRKKDKWGHNVLHSIVESTKYSNTLPAMLSLLTPDERFELIQENMDSVGAPGYVELGKNILLDKIKNLKQDEPLNRDSSFDEIEQHITSSTTLPELKEQVTLLGQLIIEKSNVAKNSNITANFKNKFNEQKNEDMTHDTKPYSGSSNIM